MCVSIANFGLELCLFVYCCYCISLIEKENKNLDYIKYRGIFLDHDVVNISQVFKVEAHNYDL